MTKVKKSEDDLKTYLKSIHKNCLRRS